MKATVITMYSSKDEKIELRKRCSALREQIIGEEKQQKDEKIIRFLTSLASYRFAPLILFYSPIRNEVDVWPAIEKALRDKKKVALPLCRTEGGIMTFHLIQGKEDLHPGSFGVMEPSAKATEITAKELRQKNIIMVIPALAYDKEGYRLGYGKGYYDRYLNGFGGITVGLTYDSLIFDTLPRGFYDKKVDLLISERGVKMIG